MAFRVKIEGLDRIAAILGQNWEERIQAITQAVGHEIQSEVAPYPPETIANSPSNPTGRWYERGYGKRWFVKGGRVGGSPTSQQMNRRWSVDRHGHTGAAVRNQATYSGYLHTAAKQVWWAGPRGWITDKQGVEKAKAAIKRIVLEALALGKRR